MPSCRVGLSREAEFNSTQCYNLDRTSSVTHLVGASKLWEWWPMVPTFRKIDAQPPGTCAPQRYYNGHSKSSNSKNNQKTFPKTIPNNLAPSAGTFQRTCGVRSGYNLFEDLSQPSNHPSQHGCFMEDRGSSCNRLCYCILIQHSGSQEESTTT